MVVGLAEETFFFRGLLDKLQVKPLPQLQGEYKLVRMGTTVSPTRGTARLTGRPPKPG